MWVFGNNVIIDGFYLTGLKMVWADLDQWDSSWEIKEAYTKNYHGKSLVILQYSGSKIHVGYKWFSVVIKQQ